jgi:hypothetical protein
VKPLIRVARLWFLPLLLFLLLNGCEELFEFNLFSSLESVELPDLESLQAMPEGEALEYLDEELDSQAFVAALAEDEQALSDVESYLTEAMSDTGTDNGKQAAVLLADLELKVYGGEDMVNNMASLLFGDVQDMDLSEETEVESLLEENLPDLIPPEALASRAAFDDMLDGFQEAWIAYEQLATSLDGDPDSADCPDSINLGDVAQKAIVSYLVSESVNSLYAGQDPYNVLWQIANGESAPAPAGEFDDPFMEGSSVATILDEAGISFD